MNNPTIDNPSLSRLWKVRLVGTHAQDGRTICGVEFSTETPLDQADGLLAYYAPSSELFSFPGPKAWYTDEPLTLSHSRTKLARTLLQTLDESEWLHHTNPNPLYRVVSPTHGGKLNKVRSESQAEKAVAIVTNYGGRAWWLFKGPRLRNSMILQPDVELFGNPEAWNHFRRWPWSRPCCPLNYKGSIDANLWAESQLEFLSKYKVAICLENSVDQPYYFTEKFVNAVRAGCIPVFHAHATITTSVLKGAKWIDPADYGFDPRATVKAALAADSQTFTKANDEWLYSPLVAESHRDRIWERIAQIMRKKLEARDHVNQ